jgi:Fe-S cluster assembly protein SufD
MSFIDHIDATFDTIDKDTLSSVRKTAFDQFKQLGIPSTRHEEWKYTPIKTKLPDSLTLRSEQQLVLKEDASSSPISVPVSTVNRLVFVNGLFSPVHSVITEQKGLVYGSFKANLSQYRDIVLMHYNKATDTAKENFAALNTAFAQDGAFIYLTKNTQSEAPIFITHIFDRDSADVFTQSRNLIVVEEGASVSIVEEFKNMTGEKFYNHVSEVFAGQNAEVNYVSLQIETKNATSVNYVEAKLEKDARYHITTVTFDGKMTRNNVNAYLDGENAMASLNGLFLCDKDMHVDNHILVDHRVPNCNSNQVYKGVLNDESTGVFNGKIFVQKDAQKTNAYQSSKAVLLSDEASINSKPQLEIFADDVKCSHGAAIGQISKNELFYLLARGIDKDTARGILTYAFANQIINEIQLPELRTYLDNKLKEKLNISI